MEIIVIILFGLCMGSFANVLIYRIPLDLSVVYPGSRCPACGLFIAWYHNIPVISYLLLRGKCSHCRAPISIRYPLVELGMMFLLLLLWLQTGKNAVLTAGYFVFLFSLTVISLIDLEHRIIPDVISLPLIAAGLVFSAFNPYLGGTVLSRLSNAAAGAGLAFVLFYVIGILGEKIFKKEALGGGDIKLVAGMGAFLGYSGVFFAILAGSFIGALVSVMLIYILKKNRWGDYLPYGPFLSCGAIIYVLFLNGK